MFGTSFPTVGHRHAISQLADLELEKDAIADLMGNNARRVFSGIESLA